MLFKLFDDIKMPLDLLSLSRILFVGLLLHGLLPRWFCYLLFFNFLGRRFWNLHGFLLRFMSKWRRGLIGCCLHWLLWMTFILFLWDGGLGICLTRRPTLTSPEPNQLTRLFSSASQLLLVGIIIVFRVTASTWLFELALISVGLEILCQLVLLWRWIIWLASSWFG